MLKKFPWKTVLLTLFAWMLFWEVKETITGERAFFLVRWLYSDKGHAKNIEVLTYLLTDEQVAYMLTHPNEEVQQPSNRELRFKDVNAVFRIRNLTGGVAWGTLSWGIDSIRGGKLEISEIPLPMHKRYANTIIPIGIIVHERNDSPPDPITYKWDELYVYR